jgi:hypothetical protein
MFDRKVLLSKIVNFDSKDNEGLKDIQEMMYIIMDALDDSQKQNEELKGKIEKLESR